MLTQIGGIDLTANIAAIEALGGGINVLSKEYYTEQEKRFCMVKRLQSGVPYIFLWNVGDGGEVLVLEKMIITVAVNARCNIYSFDSIENSASPGYGSSLKMGGESSVIGRVYFAEVPDTDVLLMDFALTAERPFVFDLPGIIIPNLTGFGVYAFAPDILTVNFIWHEKE